MTTLNSKQAHSYRIAQSLARFLKQSKRIYGSFIPFSSEVSNLFDNLKQIPALAATKKQNGTAVTTQKKALKKEIVAEAACLCSIVTVYALDTGNIKLQYAVRLSYTDMFTLTDLDVFLVVTIITKVISPLLYKNDFLPYGITQHHLTSVLEKANRYNGVRFKAKNINSDSSYASQNITATLKKITAGISRMTRLLSHFQHTHPAFITGFHQALSTPQTNIRHNTLEGTVTNASTGEVIEAAIITAQGKSKTAVTNSNGFYYIKGIKTGTHKLLITAEGYAPQTIIVKVIRGTTTTVNSKLQAIRLAHTPQVEVA